MRYRPAETLQEEIVDVLSDDQLVNAAVLILANKQDQPGAMSPEQILQTLKLDAFLNGRTFKIQGSTATTGDGLLNGLPGWQAIREPYDSSGLRQSEIA